MEKTYTLTEDILFFIEDEETRSVASTVVSNLENLSCRILSGGIEEATLHLRTSMFSKMLVVDCSKSTIIVSDMQKLINVCSPETTILVIGTRNDIGLFRDLISINVVDYLVKPLNPSILMRSLADALHKNVHRKRTGKVIAFIGAKGGIGTTTITANTAYVFSSTSARKIALIDANLYFGHISMMLDLSLSHALSESLESPDRVDDIFLDQAMPSYGQYLRVLSSEENFYGSLPLNEQQIMENFEILINTLRDKFHYVIIEFPRYSINLWRSLSHLADFVFLVTDMSVPSLRDLVKIRALLTEDVPSLKLFVVNSQIQDKSYLLPEKFEKYIGMPIEITIPFDAKADKAMNLGTPLASLSPHYQSNITALINIITGTEKKFQKKSFFKKLFGG